MTVDPNSYNSQSVPQSILSPASPESIEMPVEMWKEIFSNLSALELFQLKEVDKFWNQIVIQVVNSNPNIYLKALAECKPFSFKTERGAENLVLNGNNVFFQERGFFYNYDLKNNVVSEVRLSEYSSNTFMPDNLFQIDNNIYAVSPIGIFHLEQDVLKPIQYISVGSHSIKSNGELIAYKEKESNNLVLFSPTQKKIVNTIVVGFNFNDIKFNKNIITLIGSEFIEIYDQIGKLIRHLNHRPLNVAVDKEKLTFIDKDSLLIKFYASPTEKEYVVPKEFYFLERDGEPKYFNLKNDKIFVCLNDNTLKLFDITKGTTSTFRIDQAKNINFIEMMENFLLFSTSSKDQSGNDLFEIEIYDINTNVMAQFKTPSKIVKAVLTKNDDGLLELAAIQQDGNLSIWSPRLDLERLHGVKKDIPAFKKSSQPIVRKAAPQGFISKVVNAAKDIFRY